MAKTRSVPLWRRPVLVVPVVTIVLLAAMLLNTRFVGASAEQAADTAVEYAELNYNEVIVPGLIERAQPIAELTAQIVADPEAAGEEHGRREDPTKPFSFPVTATGVVTEGSFGEVGLDVDGLPEGLTVGVAIPPLGSSTALRDAGTELTFGSFVNQTEYQNVAIELNKKAAAEVFGDLDLKAETGNEITVTGAMTWSSKTGGEVTHVTIIPVKVEVGS